MVKPFRQTKRPAWFDHWEVCTNCLPPKRVSAVAEQSFVDAFGHVSEAYGGGQGEYILVRPDGYVGWMGLQTDLADLHGYLDGCSAR